MQPGLDEWFVAEMTVAHMFWKQGAVRIWSCQEKRAEAFSVVARRQPETRPHFGLHPLECDSLTLCVFGIQ